MPRSWRVAVVPHKGRLLLQYRDPGSGRWRQQSTGWEDTPENRARAEREARTLERQLYAMQDALGGERGPLTVDAWSKTWLDKREVADVENDRSRLDLHVLPTIGSMLLSEVQPRHLAALAREWQAKAPRTRRNIYSVVKAMFRDARIESVLDGPDPCILTHRQLGKMRDAKSGWRATAVFTREELELLISDPRIAEEHRVLYALLGIGMLRHGEAAGLRWGKVQTATPLGRLVIDTSYDQGRTKTEDERWVPIHPTLGAMLAEWRLGGWPRAMGRPPGLDDLVVPVTPEPARKGRHRKLGTFRDKNYTWKRAQKDLVTLKLRPRRVHDLRRTGISLAQDDGADKDVLRWDARAAPGGFDLYTTLHWETVCRSAAALGIARIAPPQGSPRQDGAHTSE